MNGGSRIWVSDPHRQDGGWRIHTGIIMVHARPPQEKATQRSVALLSPSECIGGDSPVYAYVEARQRDLDQRQQVFLHRSPRTDSGGFGAARARAV